MLSERLDHVHLSAGSKSYKRNEPGSAPCKDRTRPVIVIFARVRAYTRDTPYVKMEKL